MFIICGKDEQIMGVVNQLLTDGDTT